jgi:hypothetical protein
VSGPPVIWTVGLQCRREDEDAFNKWYDEVHIPMLLSSGNVAKVTRYQLASETYDVAEETMKCPTYQTIYQFNDQDQFESWMFGEDRALAGEDKSATWGARAYDVIWAARYDLMNSWETQTNHSKG